MSIFYERKIILSCEITSFSKTGLKKKISWCIFEYDNKTLDNNLYYIIT
mgnify:CR=1 FL=1